MTEITIPQEAPLNEQQRLDTALLTIQQAQSHPEMLDTFHGIPTDQDLTHQQEFHQWTQQYHLPSALDQLKNTTFARADIEKYLNPRAREFLTLRKLANPTLDNILYILRDVKEEQECLQELTTIMQEARDLLGKYSEYLPDLVPQEPTELVITNNQPRDDIEGGYVGKFQGKHIVHFKIDAKYRTILHQLQTNPHARLTYRMVLVHELIHQRHAELTGQEDFFYPSATLDTLGHNINFSQNSLGGRTSYLLEKRLSQRLSKDEANAYLLKFAFIEGPTLSTEIMVALAESFDTNNDQATRNTYFNYAQHRAKRYPAKHVEEWLGLPDMQSFDNYATGLTIVRKMFQDTPRGANDVVAFYKNIDLRKLYDVFATKSLSELKDTMRVIMQDPWTQLLRIAGRDPEKTQQLLQQVA